MVNYEGMKECIPGLISEISVYLKVILFRVLYPTVSEIGLLGIQAELSDFVELVWIWTNCLLSLNHLIIRSTVAIILWKCMTFFLMIFMQV